MVLRFDLFLVRNEVADGDMIPILVVVFEVVRWFCGCTVVAAVTMIVLVFAMVLRRIRQVVLPPRWLPERSLCVEVVH